MRVFRTLLAAFVLLVASRAGAQQVDSIYFHLYTDSLKKGFYNYINVDGQLSDGSWLPLDTMVIRLSSNAGHFRGNDLFIDSSYHGETVRVRAELRAHPSVWKETVIYIRRRGFTERLPTSQDVLNDMRRRRQYTSYGLPFATE